MLIVILLAVLLGELLAALVVLQGEAGWGAALFIALGVGSAVSCVAVNSLCILARIRPELISAERFRSVEVQ